MGQLFPPLRFFLRASFWRAGSELVPHAAWSRVKASHLVSLIQYQEPTATFHGKTTLHRPRKVFGGAQYSCFKSTGQTRLQVEILRFLRRHHHHHLLLLLYHTRKVGIAKSCQPKSHSSTPHPHFNKNGLTRPPPNASQPNYTSSLS